MNVVPVMLPHFDFAPDPGPDGPPPRRLLRYAELEYPAVVARMLDGLPVATAVDDKRPLADLNLLGRDDWSLALLHAGAVLTHVLAFYQERIVNEGYVRTAREDRSLFELARTVGYELKAGLGARTHLAFTVMALVDEPARAARIPRGAAVQSVPTAVGEMPQIFETSEDFDARAQWNTLTAGPSNGPALRLNWDVREIRLAGLSTGVVAGSRLLIVDKTEGSSPPRWLVATAREAQPIPTKGYTRVAWAPDDALRAPSAPLATFENPACYLLHPPARLFCYTRGGIFTRGAAPGEPWLPASIGLPKTPVRLVVQNMAADALFAATAKDIYRSTNGGATWHSAPVAAGLKDITALTLLDDDHVLLAGTADGGLYISEDKGNHWTAQSGEPVPPPMTGVRHLVPPPTSPLPKTVVRSLRVENGPGRQKVIAETDAGVLVSVDRGRNWEPRDPGSLPPQPISPRPVFVAAGLALLFAVALVALALLKAVPPPSNLPAPLNSVVEAVTNFVNAVMPLLPLFLTAALVICVLVALFQLARVALSRRPPRPAPQKTQSAPPPPAASSPAMLAPKTAPAPAGSEPPLKELLTAGRMRRGSASLEVAAGVPDDRKLESGWSREHLENGWLDLDRVYPGIQPGQKLVLWQPGRTTATLHSITSAALTDSLDAIRPDRLTRLTVARRVRQIRVRPPTRASRGAAWRHSFIRGGIRGRQSARLAGYDRELTQLLAQAAELTFYDDRPIEGVWLPLANYTPGLAKDQLIIVRGRQMRARRSVDTPASLLDTARRTEDALPGESLVVVGWDRDSALLPKAAIERLAGLLDEQEKAPDEAGRKATEKEIVAASLTPLTPPNAAAPTQAGATIPRRAEGKVRWTLRRRTGFEGWIDADPNDFILEPARDDDPWVAETARILKVSNTVDSTRLLLAAPLLHVYDRSTVTVYANVVEATQGATVERETLGSSDSMSANQVFTLREGPLTYHDPGVRHSTGRTLHVTVNDLPWEEVDTLYGKKRDDRVFMVRRELNGDTRVIFGDSRSGAGLARGTSRIEATYRKGSGQAGNVGPDTLTLLQQAITDITAVTNPVAAMGGRDPEQAGRSRENAPRKTRALDRVVSVTDLEDFALSVRGVAKARLRMRPGEDPPYKLIVAGEGATPYDPIALDALVQQIEKAMPAVSRLAPRVVECDTTRFTLAATVLASDHGEAGDKQQQEERRLALERGCRDALRRAFAFDRRDLDQPVWASEVIAVLHGVSMVAAVEDVRLDGTAATMLPCPPGHLLLLEPGESSIAIKVRLTDDERPVAQPMERRT